jgi:hypothetical protein
LVIHERLSPWRRELPVTPRGHVTNPLYFPLVTL